MRVADHLFKICYANRCAICKDDTIRERTNRILYERYKGARHDGKDVTFPYVKQYMEGTFGVEMPSIPSIKRHYTRHLEYFLDHQEEIPDHLIVEYRNDLKLGATTYDKDEEEAEIERRFNAIDDGDLKIWEAFPLTNYNSETGENGRILTWREWAYRYVPLELEILENNIIRKIHVSMVLAKHTEDLLNIIDKYPGVLVLLHRGALKSTLLQIWTLRKLCDHRMRILYIGATKDEVQRYTENLRSQLKENRRILLDYGYLPHPKRGDNKDALYLRYENQSPFAKDPHLTYATPPTTASGKSKLGGHTDAIIMDDIQSESIQKSDKIKRKHEDWFDRNILPMRKAYTKMIVAGTRKAPDDIYNYIMIKKMLVKVEEPAIIEFPNEGQEDLIHDDPNKWDYVSSIIYEQVGDHMTKSEIIDGVINLKGGKVFWDGFKEYLWKTRKVQYKKKNGEWDRQRMALQELLLEKQFIEADPDKGHFSFWSEYQLKPIETKGRHFSVEKVKHFSWETWKDIVGNESIPKFTWIDVGYTIPDKDQKAKDVQKKGKTVLLTAGLIRPGQPGCEKFTEGQGGMYLLAVKSGNYFINHVDPKKSLIAQLLLINDQFHPQVICFEENFFGKYILVNTQIFSPDYNLPLIGKKNQLDKHLRISNGINARLSNDKNGLWICDEAEGSGSIMRQIAEFPFTSKIDEIDALESCDRLLIRRTLAIVLIGTASFFDHKNKGLTNGSGMKVRGMPLGLPYINGNKSYSYYRGSKRGFL